MSVYTMRVMEVLYSSVRTVSKRLLSNYVTTISGPDFIKAYIKPEHVPPLAETHRIVGPVGIYSTPSRFDMGDGKFAKLMINFGEDVPPIIMPDYVKKGFVESAPPEIVDAIKVYVDDRVRIGRLFGDALDALHYLNDHCGNGAAMAVMFPAVPSLFKFAAGSDDESPDFKRAQRITNAKSFGKLPVLPPEVKSRMLDCSNLILNALMLGGSAHKAPILASGDAKIDVFDMKPGYQNFITPTKPASFL